MPVVKIGSIIPKHSRVLANSHKVQSNQLTKPKGHNPMNSIEFQLGFVPPHKTDNPEKVQHFLDSIM